ncbi:S26 family signal peptidase [Actinospica robiniae]|uniref:S26 family signal peptidase n=1 Tax=Actinospica robiniae TaxID=304901 RepID=UPI0004197DBF|nr:S26 family signal peptidase [Actinospica robiniae]
MSAPAPGWPRAGAGLLGVGVLTAGAAVFAARRLLVSVTVVGESMTPTFRDGERLLVRRTGRARVGQVVVLDNREPGARRGYADRQSPDLLVKRLAAVSGDPVPEPVYDAVGAGPGDRVPPGRIVVLGDAPGSVDSRSWGYLAADRLRGVALRAR